MWMRLPAQSPALKSEGQEGVSDTQSSWLLRSCVGSVVVSGPWNSTVLVTVGEYNTFYVIETYIRVNQKPFPELPSFSNSNIDCFTKEPPATGKCQNLEKQMNRVKNMCLRIFFLHYLSLRHVYNTFSMSVIHSFCVARLSLIWEMSSDCGKHIQ